MAKGIVSEMEELLAKSMHLGDYQLPCKVEETMVFFQSWERVQQCEELVAKG
ncbi:hypothetical protein ID866_10933, partial [Astraeus odoratus]